MATKNVSNSKIGHPDKTNKDSTRPSITPTKQNVHSSEKKQNDEHDIRNLQDKLKEKDDVIVEKNAHMGKVLVEKDTEISKLTKNNE